MSTLRKWDVVDHLNTEEEMVLYFEACLEEGDAALPGGGSAWRYCPRPWYGTACS